MLDGKVVGWFQDRMEFGPRALGARSIIGDARSERMQSQMNLRIKYRESFRPFAPSVLAEDAARYFELDRESPYMLLVADVCREQRCELSVDERRNGRYYRLIREFKKQTGSGVIINTSFNIRGEPIVCTPQDAYRCFMASDMDVLVLENFLLLKSEQPNLTASEREQYIASF